MRPITSSDTLEAMSKLERRKTWPLASSWFCPGTPVSVLSPWAWAWTQQGLQRWRFEGAADGYGRLDSAFGAVAEFAPLAGRGAHQIFRRQVAAIQKDLSEPGGREEAVLLFALEGEGLFNLGARHESALDAPLADADGAGGSLHHRRRIRPGGRVHFLFSLRVSRTRLSPLEQGCCQKSVKLE